AAKTVTNAGSITGTAKDGVSFDTGGTVDNMVGSSILGDINGINILVAEGNVTNAGSITGTTNNGVDLDAGGTVDNLSGATITGGITGVKTTNVTASVANAGSIIGTTGGDGVDLGNGGSVDNIVGATITGDLKGVEVRNALGTVTNAGSITGTTEDGVNFTAGGTLNNLSGATITGATNGIIVTGGIANVTNAGTVNGGILFGANNDSLTIAAGSTTNGGADGGAGTDNVKFLGDQNVDETFSNFETATVQDGAVTWNDADANFDSLSLVNASLSYSGSAATVFIDVDSILSGTGTYGALSVNGGLAPGNSIGTMNVTGNYTMGSTANYEAEIFANGTSDLINVTGIATLDGILTVNFADAVASYDVTDAFTVLTAAGGISGDFNNFASVGASATRFPVYNLNGNDVVVTLVDATMIAPSALFSSGGDTANEKASSVLLPALTTSSVAASSLMTADAATINSTLEELSGSSHASMASIVASDAHEYINAVQSETKYVVDGYHTWMKFYGSSGTATSDGNARGYDYDGKGAAFGFGLGKADQFTVGIHGGYTWTDATFGTDVSAGRTKEAGVYAAGQLDDLHVSALYSYGWHDVETTRQITLGGIAKNDANTNSNKFKVEASYDVQLDQLTLAPVVSYNYASVDGIKLAETGAGVANLNGATDKFKSSQIRAGGRANYSVNFGEGGVLSPNAQVMYVSEQSDLNGTFLGSFEGAPNQDVAIRGLTFDKNRLEVDAGVHYKLASNISFNIGYRGIFMDTINTHGGRVGLNIVW
ncbi:MAG: autotransporter domain-containing protein, partial [Kordiimonadaceae bacterium]|nr:autotransporter domain-containing protein [Kordiimonadaceae bacterium]